MVFGKFFGKSKQEAPQPIEFELENPLQMRVGGRIQIQSKDLNDLDFHVVAVSEHDVPMGGHNMRLTDYTVAATCYDENNPYASDGRVSLVVRYWPKDEQIPGDTHWVYLLWKGREMTYSAEGKAETEPSAEALLDAMQKAPSGFSMPDTIKFGEKEYDGATWKREDGTFEGYVGTATALKDEDRSGSIEEDEKSVWTEEWYDLVSSDDELAAFVHIDKQNGWTVIWIGHTVPQAMLQVVSEGPGPQSS